MKTRVKPKSIVRYLCGQTLGGSNFLIHSKRCEKKWQNAGSPKPKPLQKKSPRLTPRYDKIISISNPTHKQLDEYNKISSTRSPGSGRAFLSDRLEEHLKSCKAGAVSVQEIKGSVSHPRGIICYICEKEYDMANIAIHLKNCKKKWEQEESLKPPRERYSLQRPPKNFGDIKIKGRSMRQYDMNACNEEAFNKFGEESIVPCPNCGKKLLSDGLEVHLRGCGKYGKKKGNPKGVTMSLGKAKLGLEFIKKKPIPSSGKMMISPPKIIRRPKTLVCYICGREFGTASLEIHQKSCKKKWLDTEAQKPLRERRPLPEPPKIMAEVPLGGSMKGYDIEKFNEAAFKDFNEKMLEPCFNCGRTFLPDRLVVHLRSCKKSRVNEKKIAHSRGLMPSSKVRYEEDIKPKAKSYRKPRESFAKILREARKAKGKASLPSTASHTKTQFMGGTGKSKFKPYYH